MVGQRSQAVHRLCIECSIFTYVCAGEHQCMCVCVCVCACACVCVCVIYVKMGLVMSHGMLNQTVAYFVQGKHSLASIVIFTPSTITISTSYW